MEVAMRLCMYCGKPTRRGRKGEHIVPEAIGGARTLNEVPGRSVCQDCNSGILGQLDKELCSRSYLSGVASQQIDAHLWQAWDVDHESDNLLVEAKPLWGRDESLQGLVAYPQIMFERKGPDLRGDSEECLQFGRENYSQVLFQAVRNAFGRFRSGDGSAINLERVRSGVIKNGYRLAPRVYAPESIAEVARKVRKQSFVLRFVTDEDRGFVLQTLPSLGDGQKLKKWSHKLGSHAPTISFFFDIGRTMRALMKMGVNLIAAYCPNTPVNPQTFADPIGVILDAEEVPTQVWQQNGFVHAEDIQAIKAPGNAHSFRLVHVDGKWLVYSSFFGGRIGAFVRVPGPNHEDWNCADIVAPLHSKNWTFSSSPILPLVKKVRVEWDDVKVLAPSFRLQGGSSSLVVEAVKRRQRRR